MLLQRVITAVLLLLVLLPAMFAPDVRAFCVVALLFVSAGGWEWARLSGVSPAGSTACGLATATVCLLLWWAGWLHATPPVVWAIATLAWVLGGAWLLAGGVARWTALPRGLRVAVGVLVLSLAWLAVGRARVVGIDFLLSVLVLVWVADIGAYFAGRGLGGRWIRRKLAPSISPGKTWEGVFGGLAGVLVLALAWTWFDRYSGAGTPSLFSILAASSGVLLVLGAWWLAAMSVVGDLLESLIKRSAGAKDSSSLLPGHGGVLDRLDALLPALPLAMFLQAQVSQT